MLANIAVLMLAVDIQKSDCQTAATGAHPYPGGRPQPAGPCHHMAQVGPAYGAQKHAMFDVNIELIYM